jgi:peptide/nickel transport system permease protein
MVVLTGGKQALFPSDPEGEPASGGWGGGRGGRLGRRSRSAGEEERGRARLLRWASGKALRLATLLVAVSVAGFLLVEASPTDPVDAYIGADVLSIGPEQRALIEQRWGLGDPAPTRFLRWAGQAIQGNLGTSMIYNAPVADVVRTRFVSSLALMVAAWLLAGGFGFALGIVAGSRPGTWVDRTVRWWVYTLASAPTFWVGILLLYVFAVSLDWAPVCCAGPIGADPSAIGLFDRLHHLVLPAVTLAIVGVGPIALHTREQVVAFLNSDAAVFARAQGEQGWGMVRHHLLRNGMVPALLLQFASLSELFGGAILAETVFSYPGLGQATAAAGIRGDVPLLLGIVLATTVFVYVGNLLGDIAHSVADPRVPLLRTSRA